MEELEKAKLLSVAKKLAEAQIQEVRTELLEQINSIQIPEAIDGRDGRDIVDARIFEGQLVLQMSDGALVTAGSVIGEQGPVGPVGARGEKGDKGDPGPRGDKGDHGVPGLEGPRGAKGDKGDKGDTGQQGERGERGEQGIPGERGERGERGEQGPSGIDGAAGRDGAKGETGAPGPQGVSGRDGKNGKDGKDGAPGLKGNKGDKGDKGDRGEKGDKGDPGSDADVTKLEKKLDQFEQDVDKRISKIAYNAAVSGGSAGSGEVLLYRLDDVDYTSVKNPTDGDALVWNESTGKWEAGAISGGGGGGISNNFTTTVSTRNVIPSANVTYSLGSTARRYKDLWLSNSSIHIDQTNITVSGSNLLVNNKPLASNSYVTSTFIANTAARSLINQKISVANAKSYMQVSNTKAYLANTNAYIATKVDTSTFNAALANTNSYIATRATWAALTSTNTALRSLISDRLQIANAAAIYQTKTVERAALANTNAYIATKVNITTFNSALANTNAYIASVAASGGGGSANLSSYLQVANAVATYQTKTVERAALANTNSYIATRASWAGLTGTNTALRALISDRIQVANAVATYQTIATERAALANTNIRINLINTNLTGTNTALRTLISDRLQVANSRSYMQVANVKLILANTNSYIATKVDTSTFNAALANTNAYIASVAANGASTLNALTNTNTALRILISDRLQVANAVAIYQTKTVERAALANTNLYIANQLANTNSYIATKISNSVSTTLQTRNIIPEVDVTYNLGSPVRRFKTLYISGNTIVLGSANISSTGTTLKVSGETLATNSYVVSTYIANNTARTLIFDRLQVANAIASFASWSALTGTNTALRTLISDRLQVANATTQFATKATWTALTGTNTALRTLISDRIQVANVTANYLNKTLNGAASQTIQSNIRFSANVAIQGKLTVTGGITTYTANNLSVGDNMIYLNANSVVSNPDLGFAGNYNDGTYHHAGFFRDASDSGTWKVFENYGPEPDANVYINTAHATFRLAPFSAQNIRVARNLTVVANSTLGNTSVTGFLKLNGTDIRTSFAQNTYVNSVLANTNAYIASKASWSALTSTNTAIRTLVSDRLQVANADAKFATKAYAASNTYVNSLLGGGGSTAYEKTFNIVGLFSAPLTGTARVVPISNTTITKIQLVNSGTVSSNLTVRLNKNGSSVNTYTILSGNYIRNYTGLSIPVTSSDYLTVDVVSGSGFNFSLTISS